MIQKGSLTPQQKENQMETSTEKYYQDRIADLVGQVNASRNDARDIREADLIRSLADTQASLDRYRQSYNTASNDKINLIEAMKVWTLENLSDGTIDESVAEAIAEIMGIELTQEFEAEVTVTFNITIIARDKESAREIAGDVDFESVSYDSDVIEYLSANVDNIYF